MNPSDATPKSNAIINRRKAMIRSIASVGGAAGVLTACQKAPDPGPDGEGVEVGATSKFSKMVSAESVEQSAAVEYQQTLRQAASQRALGPADHVQVIRLRSIAKRIVPFSDEWNSRAKVWQWEVNLIGSNQINAFCMPGGKIVFFSGILNQLKLNDDEVAAIMGHEVAHALREHARERMGKSAATEVGATLLSVILSMLGFGGLGQTAVSVGANMMSLKWSRGDESEADLVGLELAARAGYDPRAGVSLWQKMMSASKGAPPQWLSTHPAGETRIREIETNLPKVMPLYQRAEKPTQRWDAASLAAP